MDEERRSRAGDDDEVHGGMPGQGVGRREEPGKTGVYPMSGPSPASDAPIRNQESWGQGGAGESGYRDSGTSEIIPDEALGRPAPDPGTADDAARRVTEQEEGADALGE